MKLLTAYNRINILTIVLVLLAGSICYYFILRYTLIRQLDNALKVEEAEIIDYIHANNRLPVATNYKDQHIRFTSTAKPVKREFRNIRGKSPEKGRYRELLFPLQVSGQNYEASVTKSEEETEQLVGLIVLITIAVIILLLLLLFLVNRFILGKIWKPFYETLQAIKGFNLTSKQYPIKNQGTHIDEFRGLNEAVNGMTGKIIKDYETLKNFADNASHEMQTPLAVINSKLDLLIQEPDLGDKQVTQLQAMYDAVARLTKLNQSLLLLTKIENNRFERSDSLRLDVLIREKLLQLEDLISARHLRVNTSLEPVNVRLNDYLADILLNNLLSNAIRHNVDDGRINIRLRDRELLISNTGPSLTFNATGIFDRFTKGDYSEGTGLGLAIVKQICELYHFGIFYSFHNDIHSFTIYFEP
jgi:signal transduction histidine kinase